MLDKNLMKYIPKEYKKLVAEIYQGNEKEFDETKNTWSFPLIVEWENEEVSIFQNKNWAWNCLKEAHTPSEFSRA